MSDSSKQYSFGQKQKHTLHLVAGLLWLVGNTILYFFDGASVLTFLLLSFVWVGVASYAGEIKWWVNIGVMIVGVFWLGMSYLERNNPIGITGVREWWILGLIAILVGTYWLAQRVLARL